MHHPNQPRRSNKANIARTGGPNGLAVDREGHIWAADCKVPSLLRVTLDGKVETIVTACGDEAFLFPNDLCFGPDGGLYLTDSGFLMDDFAPGGEIRPDYMSLEMDGRLYRIDPKDLSIRKLDSGLQCANGIAFDSDNNLYVNDTRTGSIFRYQWTDGQIGAREYFANVLDPDAPPWWKGPDGMAFDADGKLYVAVFGQQEVVVLGRDGSTVRRIKTQGKYQPTLPSGSRVKKRYMSRNANLANWKFSTLRRMDWICGRKGANSIAVKLERFQLISASCRMVGSLDSAARLSISIAPDLISSRLIKHSQTIILGSIRYGREFYCRLKFLNGSGDIPRLYATRPRAACAVEFCRR